jgi:hypothetical protein
MVRAEVGTPMSSVGPRMGVFRTGIAGLALSLSVLAVAIAPAFAASRSDHGVQKVQRTVLPYWQVGDVDKALSRLCSLGQFNQRVVYRFSGHFYGPFGAALVGAARGSGLNLWDPFRKADAQHDYWFYRDRTAACIVMTAPVRDAAAQPAVPQPVATGR